MQIQIFDQMKDKLFILENKYNSEKFYFTR